MKPFVWQRLGPGRAYLVVAAHLSAFALSYALAFGIRFDFAVPPGPEQHFWKTLPWVLALKLVVFYLTGHFNAWWRHVSFADLVNLGGSATVSLVAVAAYDHFLGPVIPRSVLVLDWAMSILVLGGLRSAWRLSREQFLPLLRRDDCRRVLVVGADPSGLVLANQVQADSRLRYRVVGFLDPDPGKVASRLGGIPVRGSLEDAAQVAAECRAQTVLLVSGAVPGEKVRRLLEICRRAGLALKVLPPMDTLLASACHVHVRDVDINDLLRREPVELDSAAIAALLRGRRVLVTGAGGSIGSEICRQVLRFEPRALVLVERAENNLFLIDRSLRALGSTAQIHPCVADILDRRRMQQIFRTHRPEAVFHAAAHKHVPMMEANPGEAIKNNIFGTQRLADLAHRFRALSFVLISTDKAVNPSSIMGACKQMAERYVHATSQVSQTRFMVVRLGNVLGSAGSVVPIFQEQIRLGGPITVTHPDMKRFFMSIPEAAQLVLQAGAMGSGGEIFVLDMGEPVKIVDLARDLIRLSGLSPDEIEIRFTGLRPGEKLSEELYQSDEQRLPTPHPKLSVVRHRPVEFAAVRQALIELRGVLDQSDEVICRKLRELLPEYAAPPADNGAWIPEGRPREREVLVS
ncbi:MAG TPA: nucleoside-diphosphate sugar epimerase/dehydratase [Gemmataceae bacterium]|nr:nucleoside-diphosphate sugar epimerase/dehydratase [Gemmataceae bacterium]